MQDQPHARIETHAQDGAGRGAASVVEAGILAGRWLVVPLLFGLLVVVGLMAVKVFQELVHFAGHIVEVDEDEMVIVALNVIDLVLIANLGLMVVMSTYEETVGRLHAKGEKPRWLGKLDASALKVKIAVSIIAISAIHLLKAFLDAGDMPDRQLGWMMGIHGMFVLSALAIAVIDKIGTHPGPDGGH